MDTSEYITLETIDGTFEYPIYSPKGGIEGALLRSGEAPLQLVFEPNGGPAADAFAALAPGDVVSVEAWPEPASDKGEAEHAVFLFERLLAVNGRKPSTRRAASAAAAYKGKVVRFNYARHGQANGVVLDNGDFIHTKPEGMTRLKLRLGDKVEAEGRARPLAVGQGQVVEATSVNGKRVGPKHGS